jgi:pimeloyl-ACP methyl ester carboxylesterase
MLKIFLPLALISSTLAWHTHRTFGTRVSAGDHALRARIIGTGSPTVVFDCFGLAPLEIWSIVQPRIAKHTRTFSYDHAGYWGSDRGPLPRDANHLVAELHAALQSASIPPPYILVGASFGGPLSRVFAHTYPNEVTGLVLVDPTQEDSIDWLRKTHPELNVITADERGKQSEWGCSDASLAQAHAAMPLPDVPITLISATANPDNEPLMRETLPVWLENHRKWIAQFPHGRHIIATDATHAVQLDHPDLVVDAIVDVVNQSKKFRPPRR